MVLWDEVFARVAADYPDAEADSVLVDAMVATFVLHPEDLPVDVVSNLTPTSSPTWGRAGRQARASRPVRISTRIAGSRRWSSPSTAPRPTSPVAAWPTRSAPSAVPRSCSTTSGCRGDPAPQGHRDDHGRRLPHARCGQHGHHSASRRHHHRQPHVLTAEDLRVALGGWVMFRIIPLCARGFRSVQSRLGGRSQAVVVWARGPTTTWRSRAAPALVGPRRWIGQAEGRCPSSSNPRRQ